MRTGYHCYKCNKRYARKSQLMMYGNIVQHNGESHLFCYGCIKAWVAEQEEEKKQPAGQ